jgi:hypothetical protein
MTLDELATFVTDKVGTPDSDSVTICKSFLEKRHQMIWRRHLWRDSLTPMTTTAYSGYRYVVFNTSADVDKVVAVCQDDARTLSPEELMSLFFNNPTAFATTGGPSGVFSVMRRTPLFRGLDYLPTGAQGIRVQVGTYLSSENVTVTFYGRDNRGNEETATAVLDSASAEVVSTTRAPADTYLTEIRKITTSATGWSSDDEGIDITRVTDGGSLGFIYEGNTTHPTFPVIRLGELPTANATIKAIGKLACPRLTADADETRLADIDNALLSYAEGDMLARQRQRGKANLCYAEGEAMIKSLIAQETQQSASNIRVIPYVEPVVTDGQYRSKAYFGL